MLRISEFTVPSSGRFDHRIHPTRDYVDLNKGWYTFCIKQSKTDQDRSAPAWGKGLHQPVWQCTLSSEGHEKVPEEWELPMAGNRPPLPGVDPGFSEGGGLTTARGNGVCPFPCKAEKLLPLLKINRLPFRRKSMSDNLHEGFSWHFANFDVKNRLFLVSTLHVQIHAVVSFSEVSLK